MAASRERPKNKEGINNESFYSPLNTKHDKGDSSSESSEILMLNPRHSHSALREGAFENERDHKYLSRVINELDGVVTPFTFRQYAERYLAKQQDDTGNLKYSGNADPNSVSGIKEPWMPSIGYVFKGQKHAEERIKSWAAQFGFKTRVGRSKESSGMYDVYH
jgi:hypothetical protein